MVFPSASAKILSPSIFRSIFPAISSSSIFWSMEKKFHDADGEEPGIMEPDQFIYNSYMEMRNYERVRLHLYFANKSGDKLVDAYRTVVYNSNMPLERIVLEQVIEGPNGNFAYPTISRETKVINVTTRDRICYVNLSSAFQNDTVFMESISLAGNFRMNEDIVEGQPEEKTEE